ncbi:MAG: three-Cys-motif partner protein TcmP [Anaerolineales bacterium]|nr:three-Cys-motif partner protein TcmP [Anaerolineales bacterium]
MPNKLPDLETIADNLPLRTHGGAWTYDKLFYLNAYLDRFIVSMRGEKQKWRSIHYIDLFAGPGKNALPDGRLLLGSPLLALSQKRPFDRYFFSDLESANIEVLRKRCAQFSAEYSKISFEVGDANQVVNRVVKTILAIDKPITDKWQSLNLAFLDPEGLELHWETVEKLASRRTDLIIYYPQMGISREGAKEIDQKPPTRIDLFFGDTGWRQIYQKYQRGEESFLHRALLDYYKSKLKSFGYVYDPLPEPIFKNSKDAPLYRLLFACKHPLGNKFWADVTKNLPSGQLRLM